MRGLTDTVRGELEDTRAELRRGVLELPRETQDSTAAMRRVVADQIKALNELTALVSRSDRGLDLSHPEAAEIQQQQARRAAGGSVASQPAPALAMPPAAELVVAPPAPPGLRATAPGPGAAASRARAAAGAPERARHPAAAARGAGRSAATPAAPCPPQVRQPPVEPVLRETLREHRRHRVPVAVGSPTCSPGPRATRSRRLPWRRPRAAPLHRAGQRPAAPAPTPPAGRGVHANAIQSARLAGRPILPA